MAAFADDCLEKLIFPDELKLVDVPPVFKKDESLDKENCRPVSIISDMSKVFERIF